MSDSEGELVNKDVEISVKPSKPEKKKRTMTPEALERLAKAREKAAEVKRALRKAKDEKETEIKQRVKKEQLDKMERKVRNSMIDLTVDDPKEPKEVEVEEEEEEVVKKVKKKSKKKPVVIIEESSSDDDSNVVYIKRKPRKKEPAQPEPAQPQPAPLAFGQMPRFQLNQLNHNRQFYQ